MKETLTTLEKFPQNSTEFFQRLLQGEMVPESKKIAVVVAHYDDAEISIGAQIRRFPECAMINVTDSAPEDSNEWKGSATREQYAHARKYESDKALDLAGHKGTRIMLGVKDQEAALHIAHCARELAKLFEEQETRFVISHAYEGGHPDHDASALAVHLARKLMQKKGSKNIPEIIEVPLYRMEGKESVRQKFIPFPEVKTIKIDLNHSEMNLKSVVLDTHRSQESLFHRELPNKIFSTESEWLRTAPEYEFTTLANGENVSRIYTSAGIDATRWTTLVQSAKNELGLD